MWQRKSDPYINNRIVKATLSHGLNERLHVHVYLHVVKLLELRLTKVDKALL